MNNLSDEEAIKIGKSLRNAQKGNLIVGSFAAEMIGESYPFSKEMWDVLFKNYTDLQLGHRFAEWAHSNSEELTK